MNKVMLLVVNVILIRTVITMLGIIGLLVPLNLWVFHRPPLYLWPVAVGVSLGQLLSDRMIKKIRATRASR